MPLSDQFENAVSVLDTRKALWHITRANAGTENNATIHEIATGYRRVMDIIQNAGNCVSNSLSATNAQLRWMPSQKDLVDKRDAAMRKSWMIQTRQIQETEWDEYELSIKEILRFSRLMDLRRNALKILEGKWIRASDVYASVHDLPETVESSWETIKIDKWVIIDALSSRKTTRWSDETVRLRQAA